ncbi:MAG: 1-(5-phosphoribosyl)-5-((5-phosphoribosylamino)methylideneamino)imidazole-4-carboxamide isomerase [Myxococcales bacterium]|nr:1-(5-phosphoribosyl)-5-((5-phosphoribosylamino)methylideneamino)imidazole-4-carboxamide isomerase [Myxococcales bacterium]
MQLIPAVDLLEGRAVRLVKGERERVTVYSDAPWELAAGFVRAGARRLHLVDLDGAFGEARQVDLLRRILDAVRSVDGSEPARKGGSAPARIEVGGGIRDADAVETLIEAGVDKVVVGTLAVREPELVAALCRSHPGRLIVAIDARDGMVAVDGWRELSSISAAELAKEAVSWGAAGLLYTDVSRDGLQVGAAVAVTAALQVAVDRQTQSAGLAPVDVIASGGIGTLADIDALVLAGVRAAVLGRALYENSFTLPEALARC